MAVNKVIQKTLYTNRRYHQPLSGEGFGALFDTSWSTVQNSPVFSNYVDGVNVGSFQLQFNDGQNNNALVHSNGNWIPPKSGYGCFIDIEVLDTEDKPNPKQKITRVTVSEMDVENEEGEKQTIKILGTGYKIGDRFDIIELGAVNGLVEVEEIDNRGGVTKLSVVNGGIGYSTTKGIELNDLYWSYQEVIDNKTVDGEEGGTEANTFEQEWKLKLDHRNLTSFALYGNLVELIKASVLGIVNDFPASLWLLKQEYGSEEPRTTFYEVHNPFNINIFTSNEDPYIDNIRVFQQNYKQYEVIETIIKTPENSRCKSVSSQIYLTNCKRDINSVKAEYRYVYVKKLDFIGYVGSIPEDIIHENFPPQNNDKFTLDNNDLIVTTEEVDFLDNDYHPPIRLLDSIFISVMENKEECLDTRDFTIKITFNYCDEINTCTLVNYTAEISGINDENLVGFHIRPREGYINDFFNNLTDFQKVMLNRNTVPIYTFTFYTPEQDNDGNYTGMYTNESFTLETQDGWNIDLDSVSYQRMVKRLTDAAEYMDTMKCDNIYRMLTHDSLKTFDWSLNRIEDKALAESYIIGDTYLRKVLRLYGRTYDEIKKYIHGIEIINNLTYNQLDNYPDAILKNEVDIAGWKPVSVVNYDNVGIVTDQLYYGWQQKYNAVDIENEFYRRLLLNSSYIASRKGTKYGIEMLMNLFGIERNKWSIEEVVYVAEGSSYGPEGELNGEMIPDEIPTSSGDIREGYVYDVSGSAITYNGITYQSGQEFVGISGKTDFEPSTLQVIFNPLKNISILNRMVPYTENGEVYYTNELAVGREYGDEEQIHPLPITKYYYGDFEPCKKCNGSGSNVDGLRCFQCHGLGKVRHYRGVPFFHGNSERLYYQQFGGWYQDTQAELRMVENISDLKDLIIRLGQEEGTLVFVRNDDEWKIGIDDKSIYSHYWVLIDSNKSLIRNGWVNLEVKDTLEPFPITTVNTNITVEINIQAYYQTNTTNEGNNPHTGGTLGYDYGNSYLQHIGYDIYDAKNENITPKLKYKRGDVENTNGLFNHTLNNSPQCMWDKLQYSLLENVGFKLRGYIDNKGCWAVYRNEGYQNRLNTGFIQNPIIHETDMEWVEKTIDMLNEEEGFEFNRNMLEELIESIKEGEDFEFKNMFVFDNNNTNTKSFRLEIIYEVEEELKKYVSKIIDIMEKLNEEFDEEIGWNCYKKVIIEREVDIKEVKEEGVVVIEEKKIKLWFANLWFSTNGVVAEYDDDILMTDNTYSIYRKYINVQETNCVPELLPADTTDKGDINLFNTRPVSVPEDIEFYKIVNCKNIIFKYYSHDESEKGFFVNNIMPYLENLIPTNIIIDIDFEPPIKCGIGIQRIPEIEEDVVGLDQCLCEEDPDNLVAINRVARIRNVPNRS